MRITGIEQSEHQRVTEIWESSVRATHDFTTDADIELFRPMVRHALTEIPRLAGLRDAGGQLIGFVGATVGKVEMLFLDPAFRGRGGGKMLLNHARTEFGSFTVDVNEQNHQAVGFYLHEGCEVIGRSPLDSTGKPHPILHLHMTPRPPAHRLPTGGRR